MIVVCKIFNLVISIMVLSCSQTRQTGDNQSKERGTLVLTQDIDICALSLKPFDSLIASIDRDPEVIISSIKSSPKNEECIFDLINRLSEFKDPESKVFFALESLNKLSDGFLSEYFMEVSVKLLDERFDDFLFYLREHEDTALEQSLVDGLSMEIAMRGDKKEDWINNAISSTESQENIRFIKKLFFRVDPAKFD